MTGWALGGLILFGSLAGTMLFAALGDLVSEEIRGWLDQVPRGLLHLAAMQLDPVKRETVYNDEWLPELCYILRGADSRPITRLVRGANFAVGIVMSARRIARRLNRASATQRAATAERSGLDPPNGRHLLGRDLLQLGMATRMGNHVRVRLTSVDGDEAELDVPLDRSLDDVLKQVMKSAGRSGFQTASTPTVKLLVEPSQIDGRRGRWPRRWRA